MITVRARLLPGLTCAALVLAALQISVGLTPLGWLVGTAVGAATVVVLGRALIGSGARGPRPADQVTLVRSALVGGVAALVAGSFSGADTSVAVLVSIAVVAWLLDAVDGLVARRTHTESAVGARFDMEVDAFLILMLSGYVARSLGGWVLLIGLARYVLLAAAQVYPWLRQPTPPRYWAKVVAAIQGLVLTVVAADALPHLVETVITVAALLMLVESFAHQVIWLARERSRVGVATESYAAGVTGRSRNGWPARTTLAWGSTATAVGVLWVALALPDQLGQLTPATFVQIPAEGLVLTAAALLIPARPRRILAAAAGGVLGVLVLLKILDMGYYAELNRAFNPIDWRSLGPALGVLRDSVGSAWATVAVVGAGLLAIAVVVLAAWAALRVTRLSAAHRRSSAWVVGALGAVWIASATMGLDVAPQTPVASTWTSGFALTEVQTVAAAAHDRQEFGDQLAADDPYSATAPADLLTGLRGKDVIIAVVESYGQTAVQGSTFAPGIVSVLDAGTKSLDAAGFSSRSAFLTSPTFGGISWLAHSTLQSGLWIDNQQRSDQLMGSKRFTLSDAFGRAGWRTVGDVPSNLGEWPEGTSFYGYDHLYNASNTGYEGPRFSYAAIPDQYTLEAFQRLELAPGHAPVMAEIDLVSSHTPWTPLPHLLDWGSTGDGSVYDPMAKQGPSAAALFTNRNDVKAAYAQSIEYSLSSLISFVQNANDDNLVLVVYGDHQPNPSVSGTDATHDVPISIIAHDPAVMDSVSSWGWTDGLRPSADAPLWPMDAFRNRFLDAFNGSPTRAVCQATCAGSGASYSGVRRHSGR